MKALVTNEVREELGKLVRKIWVDFCNEMGDDNPSHLAGWDDLSEGEREVDRRIGVAVAHHVLAKVVKGVSVKLTDVIVEEGWREE